MNNEFVQDLIKTEREILALKTASTYANTSTAGLYQSENNPPSGIYQINYENGSNNVLSVITWDGVMVAFTPVGNTQRLELSNVRSFRVVSNRRIISVEKIS
jgi:hypothetical protein